MSNGKHVSNFANLNMIIIHVKKNKRFYKRLSFKFLKKIGNNIECKKSFTHIYCIYNFIRYFILNKMTETINFMTQLDALSEISYNLQLAGLQLYHQKHMIIQSLPVLDKNHKLGFFRGTCNIVNLNINFFFNCMDYMYKSKTILNVHINKLLRH